MWHRKHNCLCNRICIHRSQPNRIAYRKLASIESSSNASITNTIKGHRRNSKQLMKKLEEISLSYSKQDVASTLFSISRDRELTNQIRGNWNQNFLRHISAVILSMDSSAFNKDMNSNDVAKLFNGFQCLPSNVVELKRDRDRFVNGCVALLEKEICKHRQIDKTNAYLTPLQMSMCLYGLNHIRFSRSNIETDHYFADGDSKLHPTDQKKVDKFTNSMNVHENESKSLYSSFETPPPLIQTISRMIDLLTQELRLHKEFALASHTPQLTPRVVSHSLFGLRNLGYDSKAARRFIGVLAQTMEIENGVDRRSHQTPSVVASTQSISAPSRWNETNIGLCFDGLQSFSSRHNETKRLVAILTHSIMKPYDTPGVRPEFQFNGVQIVRMFYGMTNMQSRHVEVRELLHSCINKVLGDCTVVSFPCNNDNNALNFSVQSLSNCLFGIRHMNSEHQEVKELIENLNKMIVKHIPINEGVSPTNHHMSGKTLGKMLCGLQSLSSNHSCVRKLIENIVSIVLYGGVPNTNGFPVQSLNGLDLPALSPLHMSLCIFGCRTLSSDHKEVQKLIRHVLIPVMSDSLSRPSEIYTPRQISNILYGFQSFSSSNTNVRELLALFVLKLKQQTVCDKRQCWNNQDISNAMYGLRLFSSQHKEVIDLLQVLVPMIRKSVSEDAPVTSILSPQSISNIFYGCQGFSNISNNSAGKVVNELLGEIVVPLISHSVMPTKKKDSDGQVESMPLTAQHVGNILYGLQLLTISPPFSSYHKSHVFGEKVLPLVGKLLESHNQVTRPLDAQELANSVYGLRSLSLSSCFFDRNVNGVDNPNSKNYVRDGISNSLKVLSALTKKMHHPSSSTNAVVVSSQEFAMMYCGLQGVCLPVLRTSRTSNTISVNKQLSESIDVVTSYITALLPTLSTCTEPITCPELFMCVSGLRNLSTQHRATLDLVKVLVNRLDRYGLIQGKVSFTSYSCNGSFFHNNSAPSFQLPPPMSHTHNFKKLFSGLQFLSTDDGEMNGDNESVKRLLHYVNQLIGILTATPQPGSSIDNDENTTGVRLKGGSGRSALQRTSHPTSNSKLGVLNHPSKLSGEALGIVMATHGGIVHDAKFSYLIRCISKMNMRYPETRALVHRVVQVVSTTDAIVGNAPQSQPKTTIFESVNDIAVVLTSLRKMMKQRDRVLMPSSSTSSSSFLSYNADIISIINFVTQNIQLYRHQETKQQQTLRPNRQALLSQISALFSGLSELNISHQCSRELVSSLVPILRDNITELTSLSVRQSLPNTTHLHECDDNTTTVGDEGLKCIQLSHCHNQHSHEQIHVCKESLSTTLDVLRLCSATVGCVDEVTCNKQYDKVLRNDDKSNDNVEIQLHCDQVMSTLLKLNEGEYENHVFQNNFNASFKGIVAHLPNHIIAGIVSEDDEKQNEYDDIEELWYDIAREIVSIRDRLVSIRWKITKYRN